jgi:hypothetical protein
VLPPLFLIRGGSEKEQQFRKNCPKERTLIGGFFVVFLRTLLVSKEFFAKHGE